VSESCFCHQCGDPLLIPGYCPQCAEQSRRQSQAKSFREKRAAHDPQHQVSQEEFWQLRRWYPHCPCCGRPWSQIPEPVCQDHIIPLSRGGPNHSGNVQPLCQSCNLWKRDWLIYFDPRQPGYAHPLPQRLQAAFLALPHYHPPAVPVTSQLALPFDQSFGIPHYPQCHPETLQALTLQATWKQLGIG